MNSLITNINRSVNIWKLTDYEKGDIYVEIYLYMKNTFTNYKVRRNDEYITITSNSGNIILLMYSRKILIDRYLFFNPLVNNYGSIFSQYYITDVNIFLKYFISEFLEMDLGNKYLDITTLNYE